MQTSQVKNGQRSGKDICPRKTWRCEHTEKDAEQIKPDRGTASQLLEQPFVYEKRNN